ncbi:MAG: FAD-dependent oxidoreductase [Planctomycetes bacterium]|nr:FAD-dependent oxidoreductase [Planctomycetota bacterium]
MDPWAAATRTDTQPQRSLDVEIAGRVLPGGTRADPPPCRGMHLSIWGGGLAGLAVGYHAGKQGIPFTVYEAAQHLGGNCRTLEQAGFRFDSGAHRLHHKKSAVTREVADLLGDALQEIHVPSRLYDEGQSIDFPLSPLNLLRSFGVFRFARTAAEVLSARVHHRGPSRDFESFALNTYGPTLARRFLLNYSEKLWGIPCHQLSTEAAVKRLKGLNLRTFLVEAVRGDKAKTEHLDGAFRYPSMGIGMIAEGLAQRCGAENLRTGAAITRIFHKETRITGAEVNARSTIDVQNVVSTLPLPQVVEMLEPAPPAEIRALARELRFRDVILVALFLDRESVTDAATVYFPSTDFPFTRVYEPRNRSACMSPPGRTSLVAEIPCGQTEAPGDRGSEAELVERVRTRLLRIGWIREREILGTHVVRMKCAYPVRELDTQPRVARINAFLSRFENLKIVGRNGQFLHAFIHDVLESGAQVVGELAGAATPSDR